MRFFIDNNLSPHLAEGLKGFGEDVIHKLEMFPPDTDDVVWLEYIGKKGLVLITRDENIRWNPAEIKAIRDYKVAAFFLGGKNRSRCQLIQQVVKNFPRIKEYSNRFSRRKPYSFRVPPTGTKFTRVTLK
jgi:predicted nuclease of predicted toxin-antitoxin system